MSTTSSTVFTVTALGGFGGSIDESETGYDNSSLQLGFSVVTQRSVRVGVRIGTIGTMDRAADIGELDLTYASIAGEYLYGEAGFVSAFYAGIGVYRLEGNRIIGGGSVGPPILGDSVTTTTVGLTGGVNGEFDITDKFVFVVELGLHGLTQGEARAFANGLIGIGYKF